MRIPERLKVGGKTYRVNITDRLALGLDYAAEILYPELEINIRPAAAEHMEASFLHEMIHAIFDHMGHKEHDELLVDGIAQALYMIIQDNPGLFSEAYRAHKSPEASSGTVVLDEAKSPAERCPVPVGVD